jgi:hypothetical protein
MAVVDVSVDTLTTIEGKGVVRRSDYVNTVKCIKTFVAIGDTDSSGSVYRMARIKGVWFPVAIILWNTAISGGTAWDFGLYQPREKGGAVINANIYANNVSMATERNGISAPGLDVTHMNQNVGNANQTFGGHGGWTGAAFPGAPDFEMDLAWTADTIGSPSSSRIGMIIMFVDGA